MDDLILGSVVEAAVSKVIAAASDQFNLALGWNEDLQKLRDRMTMLRGFLQDANERNVSGHSDMKGWLQQLRTVADEADDILEKVAYENMRRRMVVQKSKWRKVRYLFTQSDPRALVFRLRMANKVKNLTKSLTDINRFANELGLESKPAIMVAETRERPAPETHSFLSSRAFGREEDVSKIVSLLVDSSSQHGDLPVMIILGMAGLGKTTIAQAVLENGKIREYFGDNKMWFCVSENFDVKKILVEMLKSYGGNSSGDGDFESKDRLMEKIQEKMGEKNYLLILDDVWNKERKMWEDLRNCLLVISKNKGSRIKVLVTTRLKDVASLMALDEHIHRPRQLTEDECWSIIKQRAFGDNRVPEVLEGVGKQIANRCKGIPLVASIIGAILQNKREKREWQAITENRVWDSLEKDEGILDIIKYSYDRLPTLALKQCFAFCSIFPKDFVIERETLIQLWMAQGFLESSEESHMAAEDIGDNYFKYLLSYSLFQEERSDKRRDNVIGSGKSCKMHDLIHDFAKSISKSETVIVEEQPGSNISHDVRHLNLIDGREMVPTILGDVTKTLQTLFSKCSFSSGVQVDLIRLRVLSLKDASYAKQLPICFGNLKRLRYLDISGTQIKELPKFISKLYNLQTFRFKDCRSLQMPPRGIGDLISLKHIYFSDKERMPANLGRLTTLQTLPIFFVGTTEGCKIEELGSLRKLKERLVICELELVTGKSAAKGAKLKDKEIEHLEFYWSRGNGNQDQHEDVLEGLQPPSNIRRLRIGGYGGRNLASWMLLLKDLVELEIFSCEMLHRISDINGFLSLQRLNVSFCNELTSLGDGDGAHISTSLKELFIHECPKLKRLSVSGLSSLEVLEIQQCHELTSLDDSEGALTSLKRLSIVECEKLERFLVNRLSSLEELEIIFALGIRSIGDSLSSSTCLKQLDLAICPELELIPSLEGLVSLKTLHVKGCDKLECLPTGLSSCTALEELNIQACYNLVSIPEESKHLPSLVRVTIGNCRDLSSFLEETLGSVSCLRILELGPFSEELEEFPSLSCTSTSTTASLEDLHLRGWGESLTLPHQIQRLTALRHLTITRFNGVEEALLGNLSCLETLTIKHCISLRRLGGLSSVKVLEITYCPNLVSFLGELKELCYLTIENCPKLAGFVEESLSCCTRLWRLAIGPFLEELEEFPSLSSIHTSLKWLYLYGWEKLTHLPQIQHLTALERLNIYNFSGMESLPDWFNNLSSLQHLNIQSSPNKLKQRCIEGSGPDWHMISHIPTRSIVEQEYKFESESESDFED